MKKNKWPFLINPEMDRLAYLNGFYNWTCLVPNSNLYWYRYDGHFIKLDLNQGNVFDQLMKYDIDNKIQNSLEWKFRKKFYDNLERIWPLNIYRSLDEKLSNINSNWSVVGYYNDKIVLISINGDVTTVNDLVEAVDLNIEKHSNNKINYRGAGKWPLLFNQEMDEHVISQGISNWSCLSTKSNTWWLRRDGHIINYSVSDKGSYMDKLNQYDIDFPIKR